MNARAGGTVTSFMCNLYEMYQSNGRLRMQWCKDEMIDCTIVIVCIYNVLYTCDIKTICDRKSRIDGIHVVT